MKDQEIIIAVAKLDGWHDFVQVTGKEDWLGTFGEEFAGKWMGWPPGRKYAQLLPNYLESRDAIIPVIEKQGLGIKYTLGWKLSEELNFDEESLSDVDNLGYRFTDILCATPRQLCNALLKSTGNWKEQP